MSGSARLYLAIGSGGALGSLARWTASIAALDLFGPGFPWGTLAVNVAGSLLIGFAYVLTGPGGRAPAGPALRHFVMAGFCGGFTTFSMFSLETVLLLRQQAWVAASAYVASSLASWLAAAWIGSRIALRLNRAAG